VRATVLASWRDRLGGLAGRCQDPAERRRVDDALRGLNLGT
jgi:hypothetical protein